MASMPRGFALLALLFLLPGTTGAQPPRWAGIVQKIDGKWDLLNEKGERVRELKLYLPVPEGAKVKITAPSGRANGYLKIAFRNGTYFEACCGGLVSCQRRGDCGEAISLPQETKASSLSRLLVFAGDLLFGEPERYLVPAIGGRAGGAALPAQDILLADGIVGAAETVELGNLLRLNPKSNAPARECFLEASPIIEGIPGTPVGKPAKVEWVGESAKVNLPLTPGLFRLAVWRPEDGKLAPSEEDIWVLAIDSGRLATARQEFATASSMEEGLEPAFVGALLRAYLHRMAGNLERK